jgi:HEAT repeat protein
MLRMSPCDRKGVIIVIYLCMEPAKKDSADLKTMLADYMENGLLDNIIDMFKHDQSLYAYIGDLITDERIRVRIGATALVESLRKEDPGNIVKAIPHLLPLLKAETPVSRGDAAYLLGVIGGKEVVPFLNEIINDADSDVRMIAREAIEDIAANTQSR